MSDKFESSTVGVRAVTEVNVSAVTDASSVTHDGSQGGVPDVMLVFFGFVIVIGVVGSFANGLVLRVLQQDRKWRSQTSNLLTVNQVVMDLYSCVMLTISYFVRTLRLKMVGLEGRLVCALIETDLFVFVGLTGSIASVGTITAERYFKVVHPISHRKNFRNWMVYVAISLTWINGILTNISGGWTSQVIGDTCFSYYAWPSSHAATAYGVFIITWEYFVPMLMFVYCYGHILLVIRAQMRVFHGGGGNQDAAESAAAGQQASANKAQMSVIATMIGICVAFAVCWTPNQIWYLLSTVDHPVSTDAYFVTLFMIFLNTTLNPFIYAVKHDAVRKGLAGMLRLRRGPISTATVTHVTIA